MLCASTAGRRRKGASSSRRSGPSTAEFSSSAIRVGSRTGSDGVQGRRSLTTMTYELKRFQCRAFYPGKVRGLFGRRAKEVVIFQNMIEADDAQRALNKFCRDLMAAGGPDWQIQDDFNVEIRELKP